MSQSGTTNNQYQFAGEQLDGAIGDYYLRQRFYDSNTGNFMSRDAFEGSLEHPTSLQKYQYADRNPVRNTDPTGYITMGEASATLFLSSILIGIAPGAITSSFARDRYTGTEGPDDSVIIYVGFGIFTLSGENSFPAGHVAIEVNGKVYSFPDDYSTRINPKIPGILNPSLYIPKEQEDYLYEFHRYSLNYSSAEKRQLIASLETSLSSKYSNTQNYAAGFPLTLSHALNCTTFVAENLPSKGGLFNALVKSNYIPYGLGWGLDQVDRISRGYNVKKLTTLSRPI